ncbi:MAG: deoxyribose-phosphate aldolase [Kiritimatiellae bacterium]|nr:deoxyribose-phosphate aldolase [Kiritimatiellia bacterium]
MDIAKFIDHTFLRPDGSPSDIARLCREARRFGFASVCVHPCEVARCSRLLRGSGVKVCTVVGFPLGQNTPATIAFEARRAVEDGAEELDYVVNVSRLKFAAKRGARSRAAKALADDLRGGIAAAKEVSGDVVTKLIIECCSLSRPEKVFACRMARAAGFDFVKTSTGFGRGGATVADVRLMRRTVGPEMGVKAAGGIRTREDALAMIAAGATRIGCSAGVEIAGS